MCTWQAFFGPYSAARTPKTIYGSKQNANKAKFKATSATKFRLVIDNNIILIFGLTFKSRKLHVYIDEKVYHVMVRLITKIVSAYNSPIFLEEGCG